jgi:hypothetical protein
LARRWQANAGRIYSAQQQVRDIGIWKMLGVSVASIGALLSRDFLRPVLLRSLRAGRANPVENLRSE